MVVLCLASTSDPYEADVSNGILLKMLSLTKSTARFARGRLEVINFVTLEGNADLATSTKSFGYL